MQPGQQPPEDMDLSAACTSMGLLWGSGQRGDVRLTGQHLCNEASFHSLRQIGFPGKLRDVKETKFCEVKSTRLKGRLDLGKTERKLMWQDEHMWENWVKEDRVDQAGEHSPHAILDVLSLVGTVHGFEVWWVGLGWRHKGTRLHICCECSRQCAWWAQENVPKQLSRRSNMYTLSNAW